MVLSFDVANSEGLTEREKRVLYKFFASRLTKENVVSLACEESRSQAQNKKTVNRRFFQLLKAGFFVPKKRIASKPSKNAIQKRKVEKQKRGELKKSRQKPRFD